MGCPFVCGATLGLFFPCGRSDGLVLLFFGSSWCARANRFITLTSPSLYPLHADLWGIPVWGLLLVLCSACMFTPVQGECVIFDMTEHHPSCAGACVRTD